MSLWIQESYGTYAELRHKVAEAIASENTDPDKVVDLEAQRDYMDMVCRSFASRLERRRNLVISSARFHRLVEQVHYLCQIARHIGNRLRTRLT